MEQNQICKICNHPKNEHRVHIAPDHTGEKIKHIGCYVRVKTDYIEDFLGKGNTMPVGHTCSCHGVKENTYLKNGIKKYQKFLKTLPKTYDNAYRRKEILSLIRRFKQDIKDNPKNLLWWQLEQNEVVQICK